MNSLSSSSARTFLIRILTIVVQVPTSILVARILGVEGKGLYTLMTVLPWIVSYVVMGGTDTATTYLLSGKKAGLRSLVVQSICFSLLFSAVAIPAYIYLIVPHVFGGLSTILLFISSALIPLALAKYYSLSLLLGQEKVTLFNYQYMITSILVLILVSLAGMFNKNLPYVLGAFAFGNLLALPVALYMIVGSGKIVEHKVTEGNLLKGMSLLKTSLSYGWRGHPGGILVTLNQRLDIFILGALSDPREVGLYSVAVALAEVVWHVPMSVHLNLFPRVSAVGSQEGAGKLPRAVRMTLLLSSGIALMLLLLGRPAIWIMFGEDFLPAVDSLLILLPGVVAAGVAQVFESYFAGVDKRSYQSYSVGASFVVGVVLCFIWIPRYGAFGAAAATTASYFLQFAISANLYRSLGRLDFLAFFLPRKSDLLYFVETVKELISNKI